MTACLPLTLFANQTVAWFYAEVSRSKKCRSCLASNGISPAKNRPRPSPDCSITLPATFRVLVNIWTLAACVLKFWKRIKEKFFVSAPGAFRPQFRRSESEISDLDLKFQTARVTLHDIFGRDVS